MMSEAAQLYRAGRITGEQYSRIPKNASELFIKDYGISKLGRYILAGMRAKEVSSLTDVDPFVS